MPPFGSTAPVASLFGRGTATGARRMPVPPRVNAGLDLKWKFVNQSPSGGATVPDRRDDARV